MRRNLTLCHNGAAVRLPTLASCQLHLKRDAMLTLATKGSDATP